MQIEVELCILESRCRKGWPLQSRSLRTSVPDLPQFSTGPRIKHGPRVQGQSALSCHRQQQNFPPSATTRPQIHISTMTTSPLKILLLSLALVGGIFGQYDPNLVGTWSTKSKKVITGPVSA